MSWTLDGIVMYTQDQSEEQSKIIARLQPINGSTILHFFGDDSTIANIRAFVATQADIDSLKTINEGTSAVALVGPEGALGNWYLSKFSNKRLPVVNLILFDRPGLDCDTPFFEVEMELYIA